MAWTPILTKKNYSCNFHRGIKCFQTTSYEYILMLISPREIFVELKKHFSSSQLQIYKIWGYIYPNKKEKKLELLELFLVLLTYLSSL